MNAVKPALAGGRRTKLHGSALERQDRARELFWVHGRLLGLRTEQTNHHLMLLILSRRDWSFPRGLSHVHEVTGLGVEQADVGRARVDALDALELVAEAQVALLIAALGQTRTEHANPPWLSVPNTSHASVYTAVVYIRIPSAPPHKSRFACSHDLGYLLNRTKSKMGTLVITLDSIDK